MKTILSLVPQSHPKGLEQWFLPGRRVHHSHLNSCASRQVQAGLFLVVHCRDTAACHLDSASELTHSSSQLPKVLSVEDSRESLCRNCPQQSEAVCSRLCPFPGQPTSNDWCTQVYKVWLLPYWPLTAPMIWLQPLLKLHHSSNFPSTQSCFCSFIPGAVSEDISRKLPEHKSPF